MTRDYIARAKKPDTILSKIENYFEEVGHHVYNPTIIHEEHTEEYVTYTIQFSTGKPGKEVLACMRSEGKYWYWV